MGREVGCEKRHRRQAQGDGSIRHRVDRSPSLQLHGYYRSTASWRVRIALNIKGIRVDHVAHHLRKGEQHATDAILARCRPVIGTIYLSDPKV